MIFIMIIMIFLFIASKSANMAQMVNKPTGKKACPPHTWEYDDTGFLICGVCKQRPGYSGRDSHE